MANLAFLASLVMLAGQNSAGKLIEGSQFVPDFNAAKDTVRVLVILAPS